MKVAISGSTGFVGAHCVRHFAQLGHEVLALGRIKKPPQELLNNAKYLNVDLEGDIPIIEADVFIHTAAMVDDRGKYKDFHRINVEGTKKILKAFKGKHFIYISSSSVYNESSEKIQEYQTSEKGLSNYGLSKLRAEKLVIDGSFDFKRTVLRPRAIYGTNDRVLIPKILGLKKGAKVVVPGDLKVKTSLTHISNLIHAIECSLEKQTYQSRIFNVSDDRQYVLRNIVNGLLEIAYREELFFKEIKLNLIRFITQLTEFLSIPFSLSSQSLKYLSDDYVLDISKIKSELNYQPQKNFENSITELDKWIKQFGVDFIRSGNKEMPWLI